MKKIYKLMLLAVMVASMSACDDKDKQKEQEDANRENPTHEVSPWVNYLKGTWICDSAETQYAYLSFVNKDTVFVFSQRKFYRYEVVSDSIVAINELGCVYRFSKVVDSTFTCELGIVSVDTQYNAPNAIRRINDNNVLPPGMLFVVKLCEDSTYVGRIEAPIDGRYHISDDIFTVDSFFITDLGLSMFGDIAVELWRFAPYRYDFDGNVLHFINDRGELFLVTKQWYEDVLKMTLPENYRRRYWNDNEPDGICKAYNIVYGIIF